MASLLLRNEKVPSRFSLYVEGIAASGAARDVELRLRYVSGATECDDSVKLTVLKVDMDHDLWCFNGENPGGGYHITSTLTATPVTTGTFKWNVIAGADKVDLNNGGAYSDSITATDDNTVTVTNTAPSAAAATVTKDVRIQLAYNGAAMCTYDLAVFAPHHLKHLGSEDFPSATSYRSVITYEIQDQFNQKLPYNVPWNEDIDGNGVFSDGATVAGSAISDWTIANGRPEDENWGWGDECGWVVDPSNAFDTITRGAPPERVPAPQNPQTPLGSDKIDHSPTGAWYVGSAAIGKGKKVKDLIWQIYRDHARHE